MSINIYSNVLEVFCEIEVNFLCTFSFGSMCKDLIYNFSAV